MESAILARFPDIDHAKRARDELHENGFKVAQIDRIHKYPQQASIAYTHPFPTSLTGQGDRDLRVLGGADTSISGTAADELIGQNNVQLTVVCDPEEIDRAVAIIKHFGGRP